MKIIDKKLIKKEFKILEKNKKIEKRKVNRKNNMSIVPINLF